MQVGFIGLGTMGARMAARLQRAGYRLCVHDLRRQAAEPHLAAGAIVGRVRPAGRRGVGGGFHVTAHPGRCRAGCSG